MQRLFRKVRLAVLVILLAVSTGLGILHQTPRGARPVGVDALDPFGRLGRRIFGRQGAGRSRLRGRTSEEVARRRTCVLGDLHISAAAGSVAAEMKIA